MQLVEAIAALQTGLPREIISWSNVTPRSPTEEKVKTPWQEPPGQYW